MNLYNLWLLMNGKHEQCTLNISQPPCYFQQCKRDLSDSCQKIFHKYIIKTVATGQFAHRHKLDQPNNVVRIINSVISHFTWCILADNAVTSRKWSCLLFIFCIYRVTWMACTLHVIDLCAKYASNSSQIRM